MGSSLGNGVYEFISFKVSKTGKVSWSKKIERNKQAFFPFYFSLKNHSVPRKILKIQREENEDELIFYLLNISDEVIGISKLPKSGKLVTKKVMIPSVRNPICFQYPNKESERMNFEINEDWYQRRIENQEFWNKVETNYWRGN